MGWGVEVEVGLNWTDDKATITFPVSGMGARMMGVNKQPQAYFPWGCEAG